MELTLFFLSMLFSKLMSQALFILRTFVWFLLGNGDSPHRLEGVRKEVVAHVRVSLQDVEDHAGGEDVALLIV